MSLKKIHEMTGFSYSTISRVLNEKAEEYRISDKTRDIILNTAKKLNYRPNILARSLRLKKTMAIGLIVSDIRNPFFGELASRIEQNLREHGYSMILCNANEVPANEEFYLEILVDRQVDGIIIVPIQTEEWEDLENLGKEIPIVLMDRIFYQTELSWVTSENTKAAEEMTAELIRLGYHRIAYLGGTPDTYINSMRFRGVKKALEKHNLPIDERIVLSQGYSTRAGSEMMRNLLKIDPKTNAVFCVNNQVFLGAMQVIQENELAGGPRIITAGFDIKPYCNIFKRPLICANQDIKTVGQTAVKLLLDRIHQRPSEKNHVVVPIEVTAHRLDGDYSE